MNEHVHDWKTFTTVDATKETRICRVCGVCDETLAAVSTGRDWRRLAEERGAALDTIKGQLQEARALLERLSVPSVRSPLDEEVPCAECHMPGSYDDRFDHIVGHAPDCPWLQARAFLADKEPEP